MRVGRVLALPYLIGCGGTNMPSDAGTDASVVVHHDAGADASDGGVATVDFSAHVIDGPTGTPLTGVEVCVLQHSGLPCAMTDGGGAFTLGLPASSNTGITLVLAGYVSVLIPLTIAESPMSTYVIGMHTASSRAALYGAFGVTFPDATNGFVMLEGDAPGGTNDAGWPDLGLSGATGVLSPASGTGPYYVDSSCSAAPSAKSTSTCSLIFFAGVAPGTYGASISSATDTTCNPDFGGWPVPAKSIGLPVAAGFETHVGLLCQP